MKIIALGDSLTEGYLVRKNYTDFLVEEGHEVINLGINGDRTSGMLERFEPEDCDVMIIFGGSNDFFDNIPAEESFENIKTILEKSKGKQNIVIIPPLMEEMPEYPRYELMNNMINHYGDLLSTLDANIIDSRKIETVYLDGLHMGEKFHQDLAEEILKQI